MMGVRGRELGDGKESVEGRVKSQTSKVQNQEILFPHPM